MQSSIISLNNRGYFHGGQMAKLARKYSIEHIGVLHYLVDMYTFFQIYIFPVVNKVSFMFLFL